MAEKAKSAQTKHTQPESSKSREQPKKSAPPAEKKQEIKEEPKKETKDASEVKPDKKALSLEEIDFSEFVPSRAVASKSPTIVPARREVRQETSELESSVAAVRVREAPRQQGNSGYSSYQQTYTGQNESERGRYDSARRVDDIDRLKGLVQPRESGRTATPSRDRERMPFRQGGNPEQEAFSRRMESRTYYTDNRPAEISGFQQRDDVRKYSSRKRM